ncbi:hypothetical protein Tco_0870268 [Tanacetum coccineum]
MIKSPVMGGILTLKAAKHSHECAMVSRPEEQTPSINKVKEERIKVAINPEQTVMIGSDLTEKTRSKLCDLLQRSLDIFAWTPTDMTCVPRPNTTNSRIAKPDKGHAPDIPKTHITPLLLGLVQGLHRSPLIGPAQ